MLRRLRLVLLVAIAAVAGAVAGRVAAEARRRHDAGEEPAGLDLSAITVRPQDLVPGLVAALRVRDRPWSWLHIPSWLAAFGVNFGVAAVGGDLSRLREMAEHAAFGMAGLEIPGMETRTRREADAPASGFGTMNGDTAHTAPHGATWTAAAPSGHAEEAPSPGFTPFRD